MSYQHLALEERHYIETQWKRGVSQNRIAQALGRSQSSVSRELSRNRGFRGYRYKQANSKAREHHAVKPKAVKMTTTMKSGVESLLREDWSPAQIAGRLKQQGQKAISHETIIDMCCKTSILGATCSCTCAAIERSTASATAARATPAASPTERTLRPGPKWPTEGDASGTGRPTP